MPEPDHEYNAGIVGLGNVGTGYDMPPHVCSGKSHAGAIRMCGRLNLAGGVEKNETRCNYFSDFWKVPAYKTMEEFLSSSRVDILALCVPPDRQAALCMKAIDAGVRAIVCEKPFIIDRDPALRIIDLCESRGILLTVNHWMRWSNRWENLKKILSEGGLGEIFQIRYLYAKGVYNSGTHAIDIMRYLFGEVEAVRADRSRRIDTGETNIDGTLFLRNGMEIDLRTVNYRDHFTVECDIIGSAGRIVIGDELHYWIPNANHSITNNRPILKRAAFPLLFHDEQPPFIRMYNEIAVALKENSSRTRCSGHDGLAACLIAEALETSLRENSKIMTVTSKYTHE